MSRAHLLRREAQIRRREVMDRFASKLIRRSPNWQQVLVNGKHETRLPEDFWQAMPKPLREMVRQGPDAHGGNFTVVKFWGTWYFLCCGMGDVFIGARYRNGQLKEQTQLEEEGYA